VTSKNEIADNQFLDLVDLRKMTTLESGAEGPGSNRSRDAVG